MPKNPLEEQLRKSLVNEGAFCSSCGTGMGCSHTSPGTSLGRKNTPSSGTQTGRFHRAGRSQPSLPTTKDQVHREISDIAGDIYDTHGPDLGWHEHTPSRDEFDSVVPDLMDMHPGWKQHHEDAWNSATPEERTKILRKAGP